MKTRTILICPFFLLFASFSALQGQEGKISKYSLALYGGGLRPESVNFRSGTRLENNQSFLFGAGIYNHPSKRFDIFLRSEFLLLFADIAPTVCNCPDRAMLKSNSTIEAGVLYNFFQRKRSELGIGLSAGISYDILNNNTIGFSTFQINDLEELTIFVRQASSFGYFFSPQVQYNFFAGKKIRILSSLGFSLMEESTPTVIYLEKRPISSSQTETIDFGILRYNYAFLKIGILYDFSIMWLKQ